ncbi:hypothetical protein ED733_008648 [Metarhizium rileyi]|uniref:Aminoglycoside phosphotransferase domain-containing protein n=1 Tax=Metarhizium rileyi (strain RCEF 4871) TaxID=1649241 RepID=A0A5C6GMZ1_METRR|nr:hypothetical protein ED733_008648 [Metarhizium rileyi]
MSSGYFLPQDKTATQHQETKRLAVNKTRLRRFLTLLALRTTAKVFSHDGPCIPITRHKIVKSGRSVHLTEAATLKYLFESTSVPVPRVYCAFVHKNRAYMVMERMNGHTPSKALGVLTEEARGRMFAKLKHILNELQSLPPPSPAGDWRAKLRPWLSARLSHSAILATVWSIQHNPRLPPMA